MRPVSSLLSFAVLVLANLCSAGLAKAQALPTPNCAWQFEWSTSGLGNWLFPDTGNRWWYMPIDPKWQSVTINGTYPRTRFFSLATYDGAPVSTGLADDRFDTQIAPDPGSVNPFATPNANGGSANRPQTYTMRVTRTAAQGTNSLRLHAGAGWLLYRLYLPNAGEGSMAGVSLPSISVTDASGQTTTLPTCPVVNRQSELATLQPQFIPPLLENPPSVPPVPDHIMFAPVPEPPPQLLPNPDNKYLISFFMPAYQPGRIIVVHGKMPGFPATYDSGAPISKPAPGFNTVQLRYWSMCLGDLISPLPIEGCAVDARTPLDENGFYTVVISNDVLRPNWLPSQVVWIPWGDEKSVPKTIFLRNTLPSPNFSQSVQNAITQGCGVSFNFPTPPSLAVITQGGQCTQKVMGDYYPQATWCDKADFRARGWAGCAAQTGTNRSRE